MSFSQTVLAGIIIALVGGIIAFYFNRVLEKQKQKYAAQTATSQVAFVDVSFIETSEDSSEVLDIKLSNSGEKTAFVKQANLEVKKRWTMIRPYRHVGPEVGGVVAVSQNYEMKVPMSRTPPFVVRNRDLS
jgi:hypothetical protein